MNQIPRILVTSVGRRGQLIKWLIKEVKPKGKIFAADARNHAPAAFLADEWVEVPLIESSDYIDILLDYCTKNDVNMVSPTIDSELAVLSKNRAKFLAAGITILISDKETIEISLNKRKTHEWLVSNGYPTPRQRFISMG